MTDTENKQISSEQFVEILGITLGYYLPSNQGIIIKHGDDLWAVANTGTQIVTSMWNDTLSENLKDSDGNQLVPEAGVRFNFISPDVPVDNDAVVTAD